MFRHALLRLPGETFADGLTRVDQGVPSLPLALEQHARYATSLRYCGVAITLLPAHPDHPDATFVEDTAIVLAEGAMLTRPGAISRRGEVEAMRTALAAHFPEPARIEAPGTLDGGDVCCAGRQVFIGLSERTNEAGAAQLADWLTARGYVATIIDVRGLYSILHLKSGLAYLAGDRLLLIDELAAHPAFDEWQRIVVDPRETYAANAVQVNERVLIARGFPRTEAALREHGYAPLALDMSEFSKMDGGLSCLSLRF